MKESIKNKKARILKICEAFDRAYGDSLKCALEHKNAEELLIATMLSAQCTDKRVNMVTKDLFRKYPTIVDFAGADLAELEKDIHSVGFYHTKAKNIIACAKEIMSKYEGKVPENIDELTKLPGVGRKTANVIRGNIYGTPSIVVDTHVKRISLRLGITDSLDPTKAEYELMKLLPKNRWIKWNTDVIELGRTICKSRKPDCEACFLSEYCPSRAKL